jgi:spore germination cell wall hydrolase CwlJ-like protein
MFPIIIIEIEDHGEQGYMKHIFISIVLLFSLTIFVKPVGKASVTQDMSPKWTYKTIAMEATKQHECLAKNIYFEARNEPFAGQLAVAMVTLNRVKDTGFPNKICDVVYQGLHYASGHPKRDRCQFSWYCDGRDDTVKNKRAYQKSELIADLAIESYNALKTKGLDITEGARYYHTFEVSPKWSKTFPKVGRIGDHIFYR